MACIATALERDWHGQIGGFGGRFQNDFPPVWIACVLEVWSCLLHLETV